MLLQRKSAAHWPRLFCIYLPIRPVMRSYRVDPRNFVDFAARFDRRDGSRQPGVFVTSTCSLVHLRGIKKWQSRSHWSF